MSSTTVSTGYEGKLDRGHGRSYKGLPIFSMPGLHEHVEDLTRTWFPPGAEVLDLGAGAGALAMRLKDAGFRVETADAMPSKLVEHGFRSHQVDLNDRFSQRVGARFDGVVSVELIEHLENPRQCIRETAALLKPGGRAIITTPNVSCPTSKARFIRFGHYDWFSPAERAELGHISPISTTLLKDACKDAGLKILQISGFGPTDWGLEGWRSQRLLARLILLAARHSGDPVESILVAVVERPPSAG